MKSLVRKILSAVAFLLLFFCGLGILYQIFSWKDTSGDYYSSVNQLYSMKDNTIDVAFFGPSAYYASLNPAVFWESDGIASFNAAVSGQDRNASTYFLKELLKKQSPKVVVVSATYLYVDFYAVQGNLYRNTLSLRESLNSVNLIRDLVSKNPASRGNNGVKDFILRWPIVHSRYREIKKEDFVSVKEYENCLGYIYDERCDAIESFSSDAMDQSNATPISEANKQWLQELQALGRQEGFELIVISVPTEFSAENRASLNGCFAYLEENGIRHLDLNFCLEDMDFDTLTDMADSTHANIRGADKISRYLSDYFAKTFSLPDRRGNADYARYDACLETYRHKILARDVMPYADSIELSETANTYRGIVMAITLPAGDNPAPEFGELLLSAGVSNEEISRGGTWILKDNAVLFHPSAKPYGYKLNQSDYLYVTPTAVPGADYVAVGGQTLITPQNGGCRVVTYDTVLDKLIDVREID